MDRFVSGVGGTNASSCFSLLLVGALRFTKYDYFMKRSGDLSPERDYEFTDWNALAGFVNRFLATAA